MPIQALSVEVVEIRRRSSACSQYPPCQVIVILQPFHTFVRQHSLLIGPFIDYTICNRPVLLYRLGETPIQSCGQSVSARRGKRYTENGLFKKRQGLL